MRWLKNLFSRAPEGAAPIPEGEPQPTGPDAAPADSTASDWASHRRVSAAGPVSIAVDLALSARAPLADRPRLARIRYGLLAAGPDGQPGPAEQEALARVEDVLAAALAPAGAVYAGRVTLAGVREHLYYLPDAVGVRAELDAAQASLPDYLLEEAAEDDPAWQAYREELFPTPRTHRWLLDRRGVEALARRGGAADAPQPLDHQASFPAGEARDAFAAEAAALGFEAAARRDDGPPPNPFGVDLRRAERPALAEVHAAAWTLCELAARHGGGYDGWTAAEP